MSPKMKRCPACDDGRGREKPVDEFGPSDYTADGVRSYCQACERAKAKKRRGDLAAKRRENREARAAAPIPETKWPTVDALDAGELTESQDPAESVVDPRVERERAARDRRRGSDFEPMRPEDFDADEFDVGLGGDPNMGHEAGKHNRAARASASKEKRQEYNANMGKFATAVRDGAIAAPERGGVVVLPAEHAEYISKLAEQERRFGNRRMARSIAIAEAHEQLSRQAMQWVAERYFADKIEPTGYARLAPDRRGKRTVCLLLSDLHLGSELDKLDEPVAFRATEEARRLEYVMRQLIDYKPQYRDQTEFLLLIIGDIIEGLLLHDFRAGSPLTEQKAIAWSYLSEFIGHVAAAFPRGRVYMTPGNHGRDKVRHPGRATARKWDGHEFEIYYALRKMCSGLRNIEWMLPFRAVQPIELHGAHLLATHADTEVKIGDPDTKAKDNARILDRINSTQIYGVHFAGAAFGHYHKPRYIPGNPRVIFNGALVPPNGHARSEGYIGEPCGQFLWESVEGYPIGDVRFIEVGLAQDHDERLGTLIHPFRFTDDD